MKNVNAYLNYQTIGPLLRKAELLASANQSLKSVIPEAIQPHCQLINFELPNAQMACTSASYLPLLNGLKNTLLHTLKQHPLLRSLQSLHFVVSPTSYKKSESAAVIRTISPEAKRLMSVTAKKISHVRLKQALEHLGKDE